MATTDTSHLPFDTLVVTPLAFLVNDYDAVVRARAFKERGACGGRDARLLAEAGKRRRRAWADAALYAVARLSVVSEPGGAVQAFGDLSERAFYCSVLNALNRCLTAYRGEIDDFVVTHQGDDGRIQDAALDARASEMRAIVAQAAPALERLQGMADSAASRSHGGDAA